MAQRFHNLFSKWRYAVAASLVGVLVVSLYADETGAAMLRSQGNVLLNSNAAPASSAIFPNDIIETQKGSAARIEASGGIAEVGPETIVKFEGNDLYLDHGTVSVNTSHGMRVHVGCVIVTPVITEWTHYEVTDTNGKVKVNALQKDVYLDSGSQKAQEAKQRDQSKRATVREGEEGTREERCGAIVNKAAGTPGAAKGGIFAPAWAKEVGAGAIGVGVLCWVLCGGGNEPMSTSVP